MRIHHLSAGTLCPIGAHWVQGTGGYLEPARLVCHCWLVEAPDGLILVDTGLGTADLADPRARLGPVFTHLVRPQTDPDHTALAQVRALGFDPSDVRHIVPTHLDLDHAGGLPDFPEATVHIFRAELEAALHRPTLPERERYRQVHWAHGPRWDPRDKGGEAWFGFDGVRAIDGTDEILLIPLQGHTRGHCGVAVRTSSGWNLHAGDAYFSHLELQPEPRCPPAMNLFQSLVAVDDRLRRANQQRLRELVAGHGQEVTVHSAHCPVEFEHALSAQSS
jgi:glyoxylase-like metal-dependent hydrolase (beta-lactamase superfamily II)